MYQNQFTENNIWQYCLDHTTDLPNNLDEIVRETEANIHGSQMISDKIVTSLLQFFIFSMQAKICVDVGTYTGHSAVAMAEIATNAKIYTMDRFKQVGWEVAKEYIKKYPNIEYVEGDAIDMLGDLPYNIDIAFIDADKKQTQHYFDILIDKLADNGIIIVDDVLWRGEVIDPQNRRAKVLDDFNKYVNSRKDVSNLVLPIRHGVNIIRKIKENNDEN